MKTKALIGAVLACAAIAGNVHAIGVAGQGTWETTLLGRDVTGKAVEGSDASAVFLYDTTLNITWLRDANANGAMTWAQANAWAASLTVGTYSNWRLPTMIDTGVSGCDLAYTGTDCGYNVRTTSGGAAYSEMASLWYDTLGNKAQFDASGSAPQAGWGFTNRGDFKLLQSGAYWLGLDYAPNQLNAWHFYTTNGYQGDGGAKTDPLYALAVRAGDVLTTPVPEPETYALMVAGLSVVVAAARRRKAA